MAKRPRSDRDDTVPGKLTEGGIAPMNTNADRGRMPSAQAGEAVLRLARLVGRQIAREQFEGGESMAPRRRRQKDTA
ncbi:MAG: hypothetical protein ABS54_06160 [Hyphomicrobium sp. SCN 65-11]|nr:MAG: hypothetical protein ABS54_06160 [Hyphomicrobium sp. SCN 65-11]